MHENYNNANYPGEDQEDYLVHSILVTIFCCLPLGIPAIVYAALAKGKKEAGDYAGARRDADSARSWCIAAFVVGIIGIIISLAARSSY